MSQARHLNTCCCLVLCTVLGDIAIEEWHVLLLFHLFLLSLWVLAAATKNHTETALFTSVHTKRLYFLKKIYANSACEREIWVCVHLDHVSIFSISLSLTLSVKNNNLTSRWKPVLNNKRLCWCVRHVIITYKGHFIRINDITQYISAKVSFSSLEGVTIGYSILTHLIFTTKGHQWPLYRWCHDATCNYIIYIKQQ